MGYPDLDLCARSSVFCDEGTLPKLTKVLISTREIDLTPRSSPESENGTAVAERSARLNELVDGLEPRRCAVLVVDVLEETSLEEIATALEIPVK